ncbi:MULTISPECIES: hypothetical protein [unclassified Pseudomonas]|uniref:hypothetical protein n=1 Tax=unclassified Pseudomonas TaxID=196821 RepID=UPI0015B6DC3C|nr:MULTISPECIES: hypothetical protein [unclassified Pseudomonas]
MHALIRNAGFSLLALSASCGVGVQAQGLDTRIAKDFQNNWVQTLPGNLVQLFTTVCAHPGLPR